MEIILKLSFISKNIFSEDKNCCKISCKRSAISKTYTSESNIKLNQDDKLHEALKSEFG